jgi:rubrerythrin
MNLGTFGAILSFAIKQEELCVLFYKTSAHASFSAVFTELAEAANNRAEKLEEARREGVTEMILESIHGMDDESYSVNFESAGSDQELIQRAILIEKTFSRFYTDAAAKLPIREVVRLTQKLAKENNKHIELLQGLSG